MDSVKNIDAFISAVSRGETILFEAERGKAGEWHAAEGFDKVVAVIKSLFSPEIAKTARVVSKIFDSIEREALKCDDPDTLQTLRGNIEAARALSSSMEGSGRREVAEAKRELDRRILALSYRLGVIKPVDTSEVEQKKIELFEAKLKAFKEREMPNRKEITDSDKELIAELCRHKEFADFLEAQPKLLAECFKWTARDKNYLNLFIQYVAVQKLFAENVLAQRLGPSGNSPQIALNERGEKVVEAPFVVRREGREEVLWKSVLNDSEEVDFGDGFNLAIGEVFKIFGDRRVDEIGDLEVFEKGITNWNPKEWSRRVDGESVKVDLDKEEWWKELPVYKSYTLEEAKETFNDKGGELDGKRWKVYACAATKGEKLDFAGFHGYMRVLIPDDDGKGYKEYPFGKFVKNFPKTTMEKLLFLVKTVPGDIFYLDENVYMTSRENYRVGFPMDKEQGQALMKLIARDKRETRNEESGSFYFQFEGANCAKWVQNLLEAVLGKKGESVKNDKGAEIEGKVPDLYKMPIAKAEPQDPLFGTLFAILRSSPLFIQKVFLRAFNYLLGAKQSAHIYTKDGQRVEVSIADNKEFWNEFNIYHPGMLKEQEGVEPIL